MPLTDPAVSGLAWSPTADPSADWWTERVYFDGVPARRIDVAAVFANTPGVGGDAARAFLASAEPVAPGSGTRPPWYWDAEVYFRGEPAPRRVARVALTAGGLSESAAVEFLDAAVPVIHQHVHLPGSGGDAPEQKPTTKPTTKPNTKPAAKAGVKSATKSAKPAAGKAGGVTGPDDPAFRKALSDLRKNDDRHQRTMDKLAAGKKVGDKTVRAAHDHYAKWHGHHTEDLAAASDPEGRPQKGREFEHAFHKSQTERFGRRLSDAKTELNKRDAAKAEAKRAADDRHHGKTWELHESGGTPDRDALHAAHEHYRTRYEADGQTLAKLAGKNGKNLASVPPDVHEKLVDAMLEAGGRQDALKAAIAAHDERTAAEQKSAKKKGGDKIAAAPVEPKGTLKPAQKSDQKPAQKSEVSPDSGADEPADESDDDTEYEAEKSAVKPRPEGTTLPGHEIKKGIQKAFAAVSESGFAALPRLFAAAQKNLPGLTKEQFHAHAAALERAGHIELHDHDSPDKLHPDDAALGIASGGKSGKGGGVKYYATAGRAAADPWAHGDHDDAADAASRILENGRKSASPPSRTDLFTALVTSGHMPPVAAAAAAREIFAKLAQTGAVGQNDVREAVNRHNTDAERANQDAAAEAAGRPGTNHAAGAGLHTFYEAKTGRSGHAVDQVDPADLPGLDDVAAQITELTHGRLAGKSALRAAKDVHAHVLAHGRDFITPHDFAAALDGHAKRDFRHSSAADVARAARAGVPVKPKRLKRAQDEAAGHFRRANGAARRLLEKHDFDRSKFSPAAAKRYAKYTKSVAHHGDHIDAINAALVRHAGNDHGKLGKSQDALHDALEAVRADPDLSGDPEKAKAHADAVVAKLKAAHSPAELHELAKRVTGEAGVAKDGSDSLKLIHDDLTALARGNAKAGGSGGDNDDDEDADASDPSA